MSDTFTRMEKSAGFDDFWAKWPSKKNKHSAQKAWAKLRPGEKKLASERCAAWCEQWRKDNRDAAHIHASTYLNQKRWEDMDEPGETAARSKDEVARYWAETIRRGGFIPQNAIPADVKAHMLSMGLVDAEALRGLS